MMKNVFIKGASLVFIIICLFVPSLSASAMEPGPLADKSEVEEKLKISSYEGLVYGKYLSPKVQQGSEDLAALIIYFGNSDVPESKGLLNELVSDYSEAQFGDCGYIILAPQLLEGDKWVKTPGVYDAEPTNSMELVYKALQQEAGSLFIYDKRIVVMGVGDGATAAFDFACRYAPSAGDLYAVERVLTVGGVCDVDKVSAVAKTNNIRFQCFIPLEDAASSSSIKGAANKTLSDEDAMGNFFTVDVSGNLNRALDQALSYAEPSVAEWATKEFFGSATYSVNVMTKGDGGTISSFPTVMAGNDATVNITVKKGYYISGVLINGVPYGVSALTQSSNNTSIYTYTFENVTSNCGIEVTFAEEDKKPGAADDFIDGLITKLTFMAVIIAAVGVSVFAVDRLLSLRKKKIQ